MKRHALNFISVFFFFLLLSAVGYAQMLVFYDPFQRDVFDPWVSYGSGMSISALNGYVRYTGTTLGGFYRTFSNLGDFNYSIDWKDVNYNNAAIFHTAFNDSNGNNITFYIGNTGSAQYVVRIYFNGTQYNSSSVPTISWLTGQWATIVMTRTGNLAEIKIYYNNSLVNGSYVRYMLSDQQPVNMVFEQVYGSFTEEVYLDEAYLYGLPTKYYLWTSDKTCESLDYPIGSWIGCSPASIMIPLDCRENATSYLLGKIFASPVGYCSGDTTDVTIRLWNPWNTNNSTTTWNTCIDNQAAYLWHNYSISETVTSLVEGTASAACTCWDVFRVYGRMHVECHRPEGSTTITFPNGTTATVYCEPSVTWCENSYTRGWLGYDCSHNFENCPNGCLNAACQATPTPQAPLVNQTQLEQAGAGWMAGFMTPLFLSTIFAVGLSGFVTAVATKYGMGSYAGLIFMGTLGLIILIYSVPQVNIYPSWIAIIYLLVAGYIFARYVGVLK